MRCSRSKKGRTRDCKHHKNNLASKCFWLVLFGRSKFDEIGQHVKFETTNDEMHKPKHAKSDEEHSRPKIEQSMRPHFSHHSPTIRDKKRSGF